VLQQVSLLQEQASLLVWQAFRQGLRLRLHLERDSPNLRLSHRQRQQAQQARPRCQQQAQQVQASQMDTFKRAQATCLGAKGYTVN